MSLGLLCLILLGLAAAGYVLGQRRAVASAGGDIRKLHSLPGFYGQITALGVIVPTFALIVVWLLAQGFIIQNSALSHITPADIAEGSSVDLAMADVTRLARGLATLVAKGTDLAPLLADTAALKTALGDAGVAMGNDPTPAMIAAAQAVRTTTAELRWGLTVVALVLAVGGLVWGLTRVKPDYRARNATERVSSGNSRS